MTVTETGSQSFGAFAPDIPGCIAFSKDRTNLLTLYKAAAEAHFLQFSINGEPLPTVETTEIPGLTVGVPSGSITLEWTTVELPILAHTA